jgi:hypothetical protein
MIASSPFSPNMNGSSQQIIILLEVHVTLPSSSLSTVAPMCLFLSLWFPCNNRLLRSSFLCSSGLAYGDIGGIVRHTALVAEYLVREPQIGEYPLTDGTGPGNFQGWQDCLIIILASIIL